MSCHITALPLTAEAFAPFGDVLDFGTPSREDHGVDAGSIDSDVTFDTDRGDEPLSIRHVVAETDDSPFVLWSLECHLMHRRTVLPLSTEPYVFVVAPDVDGRPGEPVAFRTNGLQGVQYLPGVWHHAYASMSEPQPFCIIESVDQAAERRILDRPWIIELAADSDRQTA